MTACSLLVSVFASVGTACSMVVFTDGQTVGGGGTHASCTLWAQMSCLM
jgi:hypothetical protein